MGCAASSPSPNNTTFKVGRKPSDESMPRPRNPTDGSLVGMPPTTIGGGGSTFRGDDSPTPTRASLGAGNVNNNNNNSSPRGGESLSYSPTSSPRAQAMMNAMMTQSLTGPTITSAVLELHNDRMFAAAAEAKRLGTRPTSPPRLPAKEIERRFMPKYQLENPEGPVEETIEFMTFRDRFVASYYFVKEWCEAYVLPTLEEGEEDANEPQLVRNNNENNTSEEVLADTATPNNTIINNNTKDTSGEMDDEVLHASSLFTLRLSTKDQTMLLGGSQHTTTSKSFAVAAESYATSPSATSALTTSVPNSRSVGLVCCTEVQA
eukprot:PhM_4_TR7554/c0_g1_i1/m.44855